MVEHGSSPNTNWSERWGVVLMTVALPPHELAVASPEGEPSSLDDSHGAVVVWITGDAVHLPRLSSTRSLIHSPSANHTLKGVSAHDHTHVVAMSAIQTPNTSDGSCTMVNVAVIWMNGDLAIWRFNLNCIEQKNISCPRMILIEDSLVTMSRSPLQWVCMPMKFNDDNVGLVIATRSRVFILDCWGSCREIGVLDVRQKLNPFVAAVIVDVYEESIAIATLNGDIRVIVNWNHHQDYEELDVNIQKRIITVSARSGYANAPASISLFRDEMNLLKLAVLDGDGMLSMYLIDGVLCVDCGNNAQSPTYPRLIASQSCFTLHSTTASASSWNIDLESLPISLCWAYNYLFIAFSDLKIICVDSRSLMPLAEIAQSLLFANGVSWSITDNSCWFASPLRSTPMQINFNDLFTSLSTMKILNETNEIEKSSPLSANRLVRRSPTARKRSNRLDRPIMFHKTIRSSGYGRSYDSFASSNARKKNVKTTSSNASKSEMNNCRSNELNVPTLFKLHSTSMTAISYFNDGSRLASAASDGSLLIWSDPSRKNIDKLKAYGCSGVNSIELRAHNAPIRSLSWSLSSNHNMMRLLTASDDGIVQLHTLKSSSSSLGPIWKTHVFEAKVESSLIEAKLIRSSNFVLIASESNISLYTYSFSSNGRCATRCVWKNNAELFASSFAAVTMGDDDDARFVLCAARDRSLQMRDCGRADVPCVWRCERVHDRPVHTLKLSRTHTMESFAMSLATDDRALIWDMRSRGRAVNCLMGHTNRQRTIGASLSSTNPFSVLIGSEDGSCFLHDLRMGSYVHAWRLLHRDTITCIDCSPIGNNFISGAFDGTLALVLPTHAFQ